MREFIEEYFDSVVGCLKKIPIENIERITDILLNTYERQAKLFITGNGGSAATASHLACDLSKTILGVNPIQKEKRFQVLSLTANIAIMTAWANDEGYENIFSEQLKNMANEGDLLIVISASGNSPNIIKALEAARSLKLKSIGLLGFGGGRAKYLVDASIIIESNDYGYVEGAHSVLGHMITSWLMKHLNH